MGTCKFLRRSVCLMSSCVFEYLLSHISVALGAAMGHSATHVAMLMYVSHNICNENHETTESIEHPEGASPMKDLRPPRLPNCQANQLLRSHSKTA